MRYELEKYIKGMEKGMELAKSASGCTDEDLDINYKIISALAPNFREAQEHLVDYTFFLTELRKEQVKALGYNTNDSAYLYCQLKFCKEFLQEKLAEFLSLKEDDGIKEYFVIANYEYNEGVLMENGHIFAVYEDEFGDIVHFYPYPDATGFRNGYGDGIPELEENFDYNLFW